MQSSRHAAALISRMAKNSSTTNIRKRVGWSCMAGGCQMIMVMGDLCWNSYQVGLEGFLTLETG